MMTWFRLTLSLVCGALLCLLLGRNPPADWNSQSYVVRSQPCFDQGKEAASDSPTTSVVGSMEFDPARAGPFGSPVLDCASTAGNLDPPGQKSHGPREPIGPWRVAPQASNSNQPYRATFSTKLLAFIRQIEKPGFRNSL